MIFHFTVLFWSFLFTLGLFVVARSPFLPEWDWYVFSILPLLVLSLIAAKRVTKRFADAFIPGLLSVTAPTLLSLIDTTIERQIFVVVSGGMYYLALLGIYRLRSAPQDQTAQAILSTAAMGGMFFFTAGVYGFYLNFNFPLWGLMMLFFLGATLTSFQTLIGYARHERKRVWAYSVLIGLIFGELSWMMSFWPFGYLTTSASAMLLYFLLWDIVGDVFRKTLSVRRTAIRGAFFLGLLLLVLLSSPWRMLV